MTDFIYRNLLARGPEIIGILITLSTGIIMPWLSRKSSNYKKIDKKFIVANLLHLGYLSVVGLVMICVLYNQGHHA